jgi:hypothetical protein
MSNDWQTWTALGIVVITAVLYIRHLLRRKSKGGGSCDSDCNCDDANDNDKSR